VTAPALATTALDLRAPEERMLLGGEWVPSSSGALLDAENPAYETLIRRVPCADAADVDRAVTAAAAAADAWRRVPWTERGRLLRELAGRIRDDAERLALIDTADGGNPAAGGRTDVEAAAARLELWSGLGGQAGGRTIPSPPGTLTFTRRSPFGVVGRILAYNHPLLFAAQALAPPLMAGNAVILKPADPTALSALELGALAQDLLPPGTLNVLPGTGAGAGHALAGHPGVPRIGFTGSLRAGRAVLVAAAEHVKTVTLELGGKNPLVVCDDADVALAATAAVRGMNLRSSNGQSCQSTSRILVHAAVHDAFVDALVEQVRALRVGPPDDPAAEVGPLVHREHLERVAGYVEGARRQGARLRCGGGRPPGLERGHFVAPAVFDDVTPDMTLAQEEVFGPVMAVMTWSDERAACALANATEYGLTANVWTRDFDRAHRFADRLQAGLVWINGPVARPPGTPFGGLKHSGLGQEQCTEELLSYTQETAVVAAYADGWP